MNTIAASEAVHTIDVIDLAENILDKTGEITVQELHNLCHDALLWHERFGIELRTSDFYEVADGVVNIDLIEACGTRAVVGPGDLREEFRTVGSADVINAMLFDE